MKPTWVLKQWAKWKRILLQSHWIFMGTIGLTSGGSAAPYPATSSSLLISSQRSLFISPLGFQLHRGESDWILIEPPKEDEGAITQFVPPQDAESAHLSIRTEQLDPLDATSKDLTTYVKQFIKTYRRLDFQIIAKRPFDHHGEKAFVIDLQASQKGLQLRQAIFFRNSKAIVLTCRDNISHFKTTLKSCNEIIRSFRWHSE